ncbi:SusD/RagB family nutrient-binding outer membrane lipoprotein [Arcticibacter eurypsychrophilus]|uniref:SusD/RagB family nutrient-binding outer membrane lipoprotein n=1 Tax=Arcticibacter eurypsychrophilus TaxID=1434752 RepID=UPI00084CEF2B|nr:SusD/RagB family nutrient-binding outer membrane lipoprotein [Arcticibacter eurypsychrophilus]
MKINYILSALSVLLIGLSSCDKDFEEINTNPTLPLTLDPIYQFSNAQQALVIPSYHYQGEIVQQIITPYGGVLEGGNRNTVNEVNSNPTFNTLYTVPLRDLTDIITKLKDNPDRTNLYNMSRILRSYCYQILVDTYGDVPYSEAGKGFLESTYLPKYDDQKVIYDDIIKEYQEATDALASGKDVVGSDLFYKGDIAQWKKLGNSLLLRAGMRYTRIDEAKARVTVAKAFDPARGGIMTSNTDNAFIQFNATFTNATSSALLGSERANYYVGKPFIDFLKSSNDPRLPYIAVKYENPANPLATSGVANTTLADQLGMPYGYDENSLANAPGFPGKIGSAFKYSQYNRATVFRIDAPEFIATCAQTQLLLAEAFQRGYINVGSAKEYYEAGIRGHMTQTALYGSGVQISLEQQSAYLVEPEVAFNISRALEQINEQYWVASFRNWAEAWANFRRSRYPQLSPINFPGEDPAVDAGDAGGFVHRLTYPLREKSVNTANVNEASSRMGGDNLGVRIFWDK